jgi:CDP-glucose 4,6-dehydratase
MDRFAMNEKSAYSGKRVLVTGHTGFKGSWLCEWLLGLGAEVYGYALDPPTDPALFAQLGLAGRIAGQRIADIRDRAAVRGYVAEVRPDFVFHLAAQPLVRLSYEEPVETFEANVMGTVNVLDALRLAGRPCAAVCITTDKCYENREWLHSYRECDPMGGHDPYSASKGMAELAIAAYRRSFFSSAASDVWVASARAGNVIGGGDWAKDRIVPDCVRALQKGETIPVRNKVATRPWQHVLEPLGGYLALGAALARGIAARDGGAYAAFSGPFNFGPQLQSNRTVKELVVEVLRTWPGRWEDKSDPRAVHEATLLNLATDKAYHLLGWSPRWTFEEAVAATVSWYKHVDGGADPAALTRSQIAEYCGSKK